MSTDTEAGYERQQVAQLREMLDRAKGDRGLTVKLIEKQIARREQDLKAKLDAPRDPGISFEHTGLDYVLCDEAHDFKNLKTDSNIRDASITGSKRASDLHMKLEYLRSRHGARIATLATATPIANSITEAHVMSRYLRPDLLARAGVEDFDSWAATFGQTVTEIEVDPARSGDYRMHTRFARSPVLCPCIPVHALLTGRDDRQISAARRARSEEPGRADAPTKYEKYERGRGCAQRSVANPRATARQG